MTALGADPGALDELAWMLGSLANDVDQRRRSLNLWIDGDRFWRGPAANEFRHAWTHTYVPQMEAAVGYLNHLVGVLHENANQQRVASGESPRDYTGGVAATFTQSLFGRVDQLKDGAVARLRGMSRAGEQDVKSVAGIEWAGIKEIGGSRVLAEVVGGAQVVGTVAAFMPPPADSVALLAGGVVMLGHLSQMANRGKFDPEEFGEDVIGTAGGAALKGVSSVAGFKAVTDAADDTNLFRMASNGAARSRLWSFADDAPRKAVVVAVAAKRYTSAGLDAVQTSRQVVSDAQRGDYSAAAVDATAYAKTGLDLAGSHYTDAANVAGAVQTAHDMSNEAGLTDSLAEMGGYEE